MNTSSSERYLGDIITNDGKLNKNISDKVNKGNGAVNTIVSLLEEISFGYYYFEMALIFRNSLFLSKILSSSEILYNIESQHINMLEKCDRSLLTRIFNVPSSCSSEALYLETGCLPLRYILKY